MKYTYSHLLMQPSTLWLLDSKQKEFNEQIRTKGISVPTIQSLLQ